jgi:hypothetical protein
MSLRTIKNWIAGSFAALILLTGCALTTGPLSNIDPGGREFAKVNDDKLACWQEAEAAAGGPHSRTRLMVGGGVIAHAAISAEQRQALDEKIERSAEACMVSRGYTLRPTR